MLIVIKTDKKSSLT